MLVISSGIPVIFKTYVNFDKAITYFFRYLSLFAFYSVTKDLIKNNAKMKAYLINTVIISSLIFAIIGIDNLTTNFSEDILSFLGNPLVFNKDKRMISVFGYANTFAIYISIGILFLTFKSFEETKLKPVYESIICILITCLILSYSRAVLLMLGLILFIYFFILKTKEKRYNLIKLFFINGVLALVYTIIFSKIINLEKYYITWIGIIILPLTTFVFWELSKKIKIDFINKIKIKYFIFISIAIILVIYAIIVIGIKQTEPLKLFENENQDDIYEYRILHIEKNKKYIFEFDIKAVSKLQNTESYKINIIEEDMFANKLQTQTIKFNTISNTKKIEIESSNDAYLFIIQFESLYPKANEGIEINCLKINEEEIPLKYKYLPIKLIDKIKSIRLDDGGMQTRFLFVKDAMKIVKNNWLCGIGGGCYENVYKEIASKNYHTRELHCYPMQILVEFGIIGITSLTCIVAFGIKYLLKQKEILLCFILILLHCLMDFDLSFYSNLLVFFTILAFASAKKEE